MKERRQLNKKIYLLLSHVFFVVIIICLIILFVSFFKEDTLFLENISKIDRWLLIGAFFVILSVPLYLTKIKSILWLLRKKWVIFGGIWIILLGFSLIIVSSKTEVSHWIAPGTLFVSGMGAVTLLALLLTLSRVQEYAHQKITNYNDLFYAMKLLLEDTSKTACSVFTTPAPGSITGREEYERILAPIYFKIENLHYLNIVCYDEPQLENIYDSYYKHKLRSIDDIKETKDSLSKLFHELKVRGANIYKVTNWILPRYHFIVREDAVLLFFPLGITPWDFTFKKPNGEKVPLNNIYKTLNKKKDTKVEVIGFYSKDAILIEHFMETYKIYKRLYDLEQDPDSIKGNDK